MMRYSDICHLLIDPEPNEGSWNMAVDETLLEAAILRRECWLRLYRWAQPTVSLGYFQTAHIPDHSPQLRSLPRVRRLSGGGAILHHHELTYSCAVPAEHVLAGAPRGLYGEVHERIIGALLQNGVVAQVRGQTQRRADEPFVCFLRQDANDIVVGTDKILGSAQRRRRGAILQHGSLLIRRSPFAPEVAGILDIVPQADLGTDLANVLAREIGGMLGQQVAMDQLSETDQVRASALQEERYQTVHWHRPRQGNSRI